MATLIAADSRPGEGGIRNWSAHWEGVTRQTQPIDLKSGRQATGDCPMTLDLWAAHSDDWNCGKGRASLC